MSLCLCTTSDAIPRHYPVYSKLWIPAGYLIDSGCHIILQSTYKIVLNKREASAITMPTELLGGARVVRFCIFRPYWPSFSPILPAMSTWINTRTYFREKSSFDEGPLSPLYSNEGINLETLGWPNLLYIIDFISERLNLIGKQKNDFWQWVLG